VLPLDSTASQASGADQMRVGVPARVRVRRSRVTYRTTRRGNSGAARLQHVSKTVEPSRGLTRKTAALQAAEKSRKSKAFARSRAPSIS